jgi:hypothetical protein
MLAPGDPVLERSEPARVVRALDGDDDRQLLRSLGSYKLKLQSVFGHANDIHAIATTLVVKTDDLGDAQSEHVQHRQHYGVTAIEVAVPEVSEDVAEDHQAQQRLVAARARSPTGASE